MWRILSLLLLGSCVFCIPLGDFVGEDIPEDSDDGQVESTVNLDDGGGAGAVQGPPVVHEGILQEPPPVRDRPAQGPPIVLDEGVALETPAGAGADTGAAPGADIGAVESYGLSNAVDVDTNDQETPSVLIGDDGVLNCFQAGEPMDVWYPGCTVKELAPLCFDIQCPDNYRECEARNGTRHKPGGSGWREEDDQSGKSWSCGCVDPGAVYWSLPTEPLGAPTFSPIKSCYLEGCENRYNHEFMRPGDEFDNENETCRCVQGQDPHLADASTTHYLACEPSIPGPSTPTSTPEPQL